MKRALLLLLLSTSPALYAADLTRVYETPQNWSAFDGLSAVKVTNLNSFPVTLTLKVIPGGVLQIPIEKDFTLSPGETNSLPHNLMTFNITKIYGWGLALKSPLKAANVLVRDACLVTRVPRPAFHQLQETLNINDVIQIDPSLYSGSMLFHWTFTYEGAAGGPARVPGPGPGPGPGGSPTSTNITSDYVLSLNKLHLAPGVYTVSVTADLFGFLSEPVSARVTLVSSSLNETRIYPNPWKISLHAGRPITFDQMPANATVKLFSVSGHWIKTLTASSTGTATWDLTNDKGDTVASGIYLYLLNDDNNNTVKGKVVIIR